MRLTLVTLFVLIGALATGTALLSYSPHQRFTLSFYVLGDTQGYQGGLEQVVSMANQNQPDFVFHCGDLTPSGQENQYKAVIDIIEHLSVPFQATIGNHDLRQGGGERYASYFGHSTYSFDVGPGHFSVINTSSSALAEQELSWLEEDLSYSDADWKFVFTHIPPFDPRPDKNHAMTNVTTAERLMTIFETAGVDVVFTGHIHMFNDTVHNGVRYIITGGAGASLYAPPESGGFHHYVNVTLTSSGLNIKPVPLNPPSLNREEVIIRGLNDEDMTLSVEDFELMTHKEVYSSFQNQFDNWRGQGVYKGVKVATLIEMVGGMDPDDIVRVTSSDGYTQDFSFLNMYPNVSWLTVQGHILLAYSYNESMVPDWQDGLRLIMTPPDGGYSNTDCLLTSEPGMGYHVYPSAGARWVRAVMMIEVIDQ